MLKNFVLDNTQFKDNAQVVVRGAILSCGAGSHYRYLDLPVGNGTMIGLSPVILESHCKPREHISNFGICAIKTVLAASNKNFICIDKIPGTIKTYECMEGIPCCFEPVGTWQNVDRNSYAWSQEFLRLEGKVLSDSIVSCKMGAQIIIVSAKY